MRRFRGGFWKKMTKSVILLIHIMAWIYTGTVGYSLLDGPWQAWVSNIGETFGEGAGLMGLTLCNQSLGIFGVEFTSPSGLSSMHSCRMALLSLYKFIHIKDVPYDQWSNLPIPPGSGALWRMPMEIPLPAFSYLTDVRLDAIWASDAPRLSDMIDELKRSGNWPLANIYLPPNNYDTPGRWALHDAMWQLCSAGDDYTCIYQSDLYYSEAPTMQLVRY